MVWRLTTTGGQPTEKRPKDPQAQTESRWNQATSLALKTKAMLRQQTSKAEPEYLRIEVEQVKPAGRGNLVEPQVRGSPVEPKVGGAKVKPTGRQAEMKQRDRRWEVEPHDPLAEALQMDARPAVCRQRDSPEMAQGCGHPAAAGLEDLLSFPVPHNMTEKQLVLELHSLPGQGSALSSFSLALADASRWVVAFLLQGSHMSAEPNVDK
ncbi:hypothetical protein DPX16_13538 [Anabarilius grahami]|uniref:Uncharacterized protein n=1 Tax=Anabarilius grahami TaxID=495550 RepID=A0A3N0YBM1_ANAGA|nr:hypothetical protein DPX16_13538 [Anabarilius grahami]